MKIKSTSVPATVAVVSIDGQPINGSSHMVMVYSTNAVNTGMEVSNDMSTLFNQGSLPVLVECGSLKINLKNSSELELWALALDGTRTEKIPIKIKDGIKQIFLDMSILKNGPTPFFELVHKDKVKLIL